MADKHPYVSGPGAIIAAVNQFRKALPAKVTAETLTKLGIAPNNESYVINVLRFIGVIDGEGTRTQEASEVFTKHDAEEFADRFGKLVKAGYSDLFALHGDAAWTLSLDKLISFFRGSDQTSDVVGRRQATTFQALASFAGYQVASVAKPTAPKPPSVGKRPLKVAKATTPPAASLPIPPASATTSGAGASNTRDFGLSVRVEVNLPAGADQETYDRIFRSIRENLLDAK